MKKKLNIVLLLVLLFTSCIERGDWIYDELPGDYSIWRTNSKSISLCTNVEDMGAHIISSYVSEIDYTDEFIFAKHVDVAKDSDAEIDTSNPDYYILVVESEELFGPYTENEFNKKCDELSIVHAFDWKITAELNK